MRKHLNFSNSFAIPRGVSLVLALAISPAPLLWAGGAQTVAQEFTREKYDKKRGGDDLAAAVRNQLVRINAANYTCIDEAKAAIEWLEWEKNYVGNLAAPRGSLTQLRFNRLNDDLAAALANLNALPPCKPPEVHYFVGHPLEYYEPKRVEIGQRPTEGGPPTAIPCSVGGGENCAVGGPSWSGPFVGGQLVGSWSGVGTNEYSAATGVRTNAFEDSGQGFGAGVNWGYNWQPWGNNVVVGAVFDANLLSDTVQRDFSGGMSIGSTVNFTSSAQARAGVLVTPNLLLYGQAGLSVANQNLKIDFATPFTNENQLTPGFSLGGGAEWMLPTNPISSFGKSTSLFVSYEHTWWDKATLNTPESSPTYNYTWLRQSDVVELGIRVRFGTQYDMGGSFFDTPHNQVRVPSFPSTPSADKDVKEWKRSVTEFYSSPD